MGVQLKALKKTIREPWVIVLCFFLFCCVVVDFKYSFGCSVKLLLSIRRHDRKRETLNSFRLHQSQAQQRRSPEVFQAGYSSWVSWKKNWNVSTGKHYFWSHFKTLRSKPYQKEKKNTRKTFRGQQATLSEQIPSDNHTFVLARLSLSVRVNIHMVLSHLSVFKSLHRFHSDGWHSVVLESAVDRVRGIRSVVFDHFTVGLVLVDDWTRQAGEIKRKTELDFISEKLLAADFVKGGFFWSSALRSDAQLCALLLVNLDVRVHRSSVSSRVMWVISTLTTSAVKVSGFNGMINASQTAGWNMR